MYILHCICRYFQYWYNMHCMFTLISILIINAYVTLISNSQNSFFFFLLWTYVLYYLSILWQEYETAFYPFILQSNFNKTSYIKRLLVFSNFYINPTSGVLQFILSWHRTNKHTFLLSYINFLRSKSFWHAQRTG